MGNKREDIRSRLTVIRGGVQCELAFGPVRIVAAPENRPPFDVDAIAYEEDTWLIMSADPKICQPEEHPIRLMTDLINAQPETVGSVRVQGRNPLRFLASNAPQISVLQSCLGGSVAFSSEWHETRNGLG